MEIIILPDTDQADALAARIVERALREKPRAVLGLATGRTPLGLYRQLIRLHVEEGLDFGRVTTFNLDEYVGLPVEHPASFHRYMQENLFHGINVAPEHAHIPNGLAPDIPGFCRQYEEAIRCAGGIDVQVLGIGTNGHIGFNEPSSSLASRTRIKTLTPQTRRDSAAEFGGEDKVPTHVITMGLGSILEAKMCLLLAYGKKKAAAVAAMAEGPVTASVPATVLQMHPHAVAIVDRAAAAELKRADYYDWVFKNKPEWQEW